MSTLLRDFFDVAAHRYDNECKLDDPIGYSIT